MLFFKDLGASRNVWQAPEPDMAGSRQAAPGLQRLPSSFEDALKSCSSVLVPSVVPFLEKLSSSFLSCSETPCVSDLATELRCGGEADAGHKNLAAARNVIRRVFSDLEAESLQEWGEYERVGLSPVTHKHNRLAAYTDSERVKEFMSSSLLFVEHHAECRTKKLSDATLRFLVLLQHLVSEDTSDIYKPVSERKHQDAFEGFLTSSVNSQMIKDAHRSEWSIGGVPYSLQLHEREKSERGNTAGDRKQVIAAFQKKLITAVEEFLLDFCHRRKLSEEGSRCLLQAVTTQMSQCGLANLDRSSSAAKYFVSGQGLDQRTVYSLSTMDADSEFGESLKLSMLCMKTGFGQYITEEAANTADACPQQCATSSYLYQYATLRFTPGLLLEGDSCERCACFVEDALDEVRIDPVSVEPLHKV